MRPIAVFREEARTDGGDYSVVFEHNDARRQYCFTVKAPPDDVKSMDLKGPSDYWRLMPKDQPYWKWLVASVVSFHDAITEARRVGMPEPKAVFATSAKSPDYRVQFAPCSGSFIECVLTVATTDYTDMKEATLADVKAPNNYWAMKPPDTFTNELFDSLKRLHQLVIFANLLDEAEAQTQ